MTAPLMKLWFSLSVVAPEVALPDITESNLRIKATCTQNFILRTVGNYEASNNVGAYPSVDGTWLIAGPANAVWVELAVTSGDTLVTDDTGGARVSMDTNREFGYTKAAPNGVLSGVIKVDFYDAVSGGSLLDTADITLTAERSA